MHVFLALALSFLMGYGCSQIALKKGRRPFPWFLSGVFFGLFALILIALLPPSSQRKGRVFFFKKTSITPAKEPQLTAIHPEHEEKLWYYLDCDKVAQGPMSLFALSREWKERKVHTSSWVWNEQLEEWKPLNEVLRPE